MVAVFANNISRFARTHWSNIVFIMCNTIRFAAAFGGRKITKSDNFMNVPYDE